MSTPACMGGWCRVREHCCHYQAHGRTELSERLCLPGSDGDSEADQ